MHILAKEAKSRGKQRDGGRARGREIESYIWSPPEINCTNFSVRALPRPEHSEPNTGQIDAQACDFICACACLCACVCVASTRLRGGEDDWAEVREESRKNKDGTIEEERRRWNQRGEKKSSDLFLNACTRTRAPYRFRSTINVEAAPR